MLKLYWANLISIVNTTIVKTSKFVQVSFFNYILSIYLVDAFSFKYNIVSENNKCDYLFFYIELY